MFDELEQDQYHLITPLVQEMAYNLSIMAVIEGTVPGRVWVDNAQQPRNALINTPEGSYLTGKPDNPAFLESLRQHLARLQWIELDYQPDEWQAHFSDLLAGKFARPLPERYYLFEHFRLPNWRQQLPPGYEMRPVDAALLEHRDLQGFGEVAERVRGWGSRSAFLAKGFGFCLLHGDVIASRCIADCVASGVNCEIGIGTDLRYRRRGLAALTVAATVEYCLAVGLTNIGWHCLENNTGSWKTAEKVGFILQRKYQIMYNSLPAENASDLNLDQWREQAAWFEAACQETAFADGRLCLLAASSYALAGNEQLALQRMEQCFESGWPQRNEWQYWLPDHFALQSLSPLPHWQALLARYR